MPLTSRQKIILIGGKGLHIPRHGWNATNFVQHGSVMIVTMHKTARHTQMTAAPHVAKLARDLMHRQLVKIIDRARLHAQHRRLGFKADYPGDSIVLDMPQAEDLWKEAIDQVLKETGIEIVTAIVPPIQSVMAAGYSRTSFLLAQDVQDAMTPIIARQVRGIAAKVVGINDTTRDNILNVVKDAVANGNTVIETAAEIQKRVPQIFGNRSLTVARTELNRAWTAGAALAYQQSGQVTHVSVIGCEAREPTSPHYKGESTCNYQDLPVEDLDAFLEVGFHPNHGGTVIPSGFREADGSVPTNDEKPSVFDEYEGQPDVTEDQSPPHA